RAGGDRGDPLFRGTRRAQPDPRRPDDGLRGRPRDAGAGRALDGAALAGSGDGARVERYGRFIHLGPETLARMEGKIQRRGGWAIVLGRIVPGLRIVTPIAAGVL